MLEGLYNPGTLVLVWNSVLELQHGQKGAMRWFGPYVVMQRRPSGAYILAELDGTIFATPFAAAQIKLFHWRDGIYPIVKLKFDELTPDELEIVEVVEKELKEQDKGDNDEEPSLVYDAARLSAASIGQHFQIPMAPWEKRGMKTGDVSRKA